MMLASPSPRSGPLRRWPLLFSLAAVLGLVCAVATGQNSPPPVGNPLVTALEFVHLHGTIQGLVPEKDRLLKATLQRSLDGSPPALTVGELGAFIDPAVLKGIAGEAKQIPLATLEKWVREKTPASRADLLPQICRHAELLTTQFDRIEEGHRAAGRKLAEWIAENYKPGRPLGVIAICTGNSRRSLLSATLGNIAASYYGLPEVRFYSGGTAPSAFNSRTIRSLKEMGVEIAPTGKEAPRGNETTPNPMFTVRWGKDYQTTEFSKKYTDAVNPRSGFAAILVCSEANEACPVVSGADVRIPVPYEDPKSYDGAAFEAAKYSERRDDIGRFLLNVMLQARAALAATPGSR